MRKIRGFKLGKQVVKFYGWFFPPKPIWVPPSLATDWQDQDNFSTLQLGSTSQNQGQKDMFVELGSGSFLWLPSGGWGDASGDGSERPSGGVRGSKRRWLPRVLVSVIYFDHPLFGEFLRESEEEYTFQRPGGITIRCRISEFKSVQTRITVCEGKNKRVW